MKNNQKGKTIGQKYQRRQLWTMAAVTKIVKNKKGKGSYQREKNLKCHV